MIVVNYFHMQFLFDGSKMSDIGDYDGHWINFKDDFTYEYGYYENKVGGGRYHYSLNSEKMIMLDDDEKCMPQEWTIMAKEDIIVMVGSDYFGNNPRQLKMERNPELPQKIS